MNNDELVTRRAQAIAEDRCFSKGRLRDEFRMKPAPGAEPVKWYKNTYGVTNGAIVIHTQRLKSDPGGNLLS
ncbi:hypothetical protein JS697_004556 [Escherichia coli]|nr:hypothetical protein [Escherichia coli]